MRLLVRSMMCCVLATGARGQWYPTSSNVTVVYPPPVQSPPAAVEIVRESPAPRPAEFREEYASPRRITYLIAFKDGVVRVADQYWVSGKTLYFLTPDHQRMTAPANSVDRAVSKRLNGEQNVAFNLPPEQGRTLVQTHVVHRTVSLVRKRCYCRPVTSAGVASRTSGEAGRSSAERR